MTPESAAKVKAVESSQFSQNSNPKAITDPPMMPHCNQTKGIINKCLNRIINPHTNRPVQCQTCRVHNAAIHAQRKRAATKRAKECRQATHNLNCVINSDLQAEDSKLQCTLDEVNAEKANMLAKIRDKLITYAKYQAGLPLPNATFLPEITISLPQAQETPTGSTQPPSITLTSLGPNRKRRPTSKE